VSDMFVVFTRVYLIHDLCTWPAGAGAGRSVARYRYPGGCGNYSLWRVVTEYEYVKLTVPS